MPESAVQDLYGYPQDQRGRLFTGARRAEFTQFLRSGSTPTYQAVRTPIS